MKKFKDLYIFIYIVDTVVEDTVDIIALVCLVVIGTVTVTNGCGVSDAEDVLKEQNVESGRLESH